MRLSVEGQAKGQARKHAANLDNRGPAPARGTAGAAAELSARRDPELHVGPVGDDRAPDPKNGPQLGARQRTLVIGAGQGL